MYVKSKQGEIDVAGTILLQNNTANTSASLNSIRVSNSATYTFSLSRYSATDDTLIQIYSFDLDAGDVFTDDYVYYLNTGDYLIAYTDIVGTNYLITFVDASR